MRPLNRFAHSTFVGCELFWQVGARLGQESYCDCCQTSRRKPRTAWCLSTWIAVFVAFSSCSYALAAPVSVSWTVDATRSSLAFAGEVDNVPIAVQGPNSLTTSFGGMLESEIVFGSSPSINILSSSLQAKNSGAWAPGLNAAPGTANANYGYVMNVFLLGGLINGNVQGALRGIVLNAASSGPRPLSTTPFMPDTALATFSDVNAPVSIVAGTHAYRPLGGNLATWGFTPDSSSMVGSNGVYDLAQAKIVSNGTTMTMTLPVDARIQYEILAPIFLDGRVFGTIVATAPAPLVPEPSTLLLFAIGVSLLGARQFKVFGAGHG